MRGQVEVLFFNGKNGKAIVDAQIYGHITVFSAKDSDEQGLPGGIFSESSMSIAQVSVRKILGQLFPDIEQIEIRFNARSQKLEELTKYKAQPNSLHIAQLLSSSILASMLSDVGEGQDEEDQVINCDIPDEKSLCNFISKTFLSKLEKNTQKLRDVFLREKRKEPNSLLVRAEALEKIDPSKTLEILKQIEVDQLTPEERGRKSVLTLKAITRVDLSDDGFQKNLDLYEDLCRDNSKDSAVLRTLAFTWIRYLQNRRDFRGALKAVSKFSDDFPESMLSDTERAVLGYLRGRGKYHEGEYIGALELLEEAFSKYDREDSEFYSDILNTAASSFTDNLFFEQATCMLDEALRVREKLVLPKKVETLSAMGCLAFKMADFPKALNLFKETIGVMRANGFIENESRILNYTAKASLYAGDIEGSKKHLEEAFEKGKGKASSLAFSNSIKMALLIKQGEYSAADEFFKSTFLLPENRTEIFPSSWGYFFQAEACINLGRTRDALQYQAKGIDMFLSDRYVLEAGIGTVIPLLWDVSDEDMAFFDRLMSSLDILPNLMEYEEAHSNLSDRFFSSFFAKAIDGTQNKKPLIKTMIEEIISAAITKDRSKARDTINRICLL
nr:hypothetical protein [uncultured Dethiosulfovibrio sp.]